MALTAGTRLGPYEILSPLGAGGMGEVYRATDTKLKRQVAIKILPPSLAADSDRLARFQREAEVLASFNHPHIAAIYGLEEADGLTALVMELVEGDDLAQRIARGAIPLDEAIAIARQIADALEVAHEQAIVHRDLKPANIKVRADGAVKVLDFGLAKAMEPVGGAPNATQSPTRTSPAMTRAGIILGTAAYMSPEQARGKVVDRRTDIWAFGCVLFEMLTGRVTFHGETVTDTIVAILEREPDWSALPPATPSGIRQVLKRCLEKDPKQRSRDIGDVRLQIEDALAGASRPATATIPGRPGVTAWPIVVVALALSAVAIVALLSLGRQQEAIVTGQAARLVLTPATTDDGVTADPAISKDGALLAYASDRAGLDNLDIWIQQTSGGAPIQLTHDPVDEREPAFSPDGRLIAFRSEAEGGGIYILPSFGGQEPRLLVREGRRPRFSPDGNSIAYWTGSAIGFSNVPRSYRTFTIPTSGGAPMEIDAGMTGARYPVWSRDGRSLLLLGSRDVKPDVETYDWWIVPLASGEPVRTSVYDRLRDAGVATESGNIGPNGWLNDRALLSDFKYIWSIALDSGTGQGKDVERLTFGTNADGQAVASDSGTIAFSSMSMRGDIWSLPLDTRRGVITGAAERLTNGKGSDSRPSISSDGILLAFNHALPRPSSVVKNLKAGSLTDLGIEASGFGPAISPNGLYVSYEANGGVSMVPSRGGSPREICKNCTIGDWAGDSRQTSIVALDSKSMSHLSFVNVENGDVRDLTEPGAAILNRPFPSSGNRLLAFRELSPKGNTVYVIRVPTASAVRKSEWIMIVAPEADARPCGWSPDGSLLYFLSSRDGTRCLYAQRVDPVTGNARGECFVVRHFPGARNMWAGQFGVLSTGPADAIRGGSFLYDLAEASSNIWTMSLPAKN